MLRRYSRWIGDTLRSVEKRESSGAPVAGPTGHEGARHVADVGDDAQPVER